METLNNITASDNFIQEKFVVALCDDTHQEIFSHCELTAWLTMYCKCTALP